VGLYDTLKRWRDVVCEQTGAPIYMVANQNALKEIATYLPFTKKDLMQITGFGKAKSEKYGEDILDVVKDYCSRNNLESNMASKEENPKRERKEKSMEEKIPTNIVSFNLYKEGKSIEEIAKERNLNIVTIQGHLATFISSKQININDLVSEEKQLQIREAIKTNGRESVKILKDNLPQEITYGEIRMVMAADKMDDRA
jgi:ATP-dependent DNA helicase RecQ